jgi:hypothetical protein
MRGEDKIREACRALEAHAIGFIVVAGPWETGEFQVHSNAALPVVLARLHGAIAQVQALAKREGN